LGPPSIWVLSLVVHRVKEDVTVNTLKPLLVIAILAGIGYGAYSRINSSPATPPPGMPEGWDAAPNVQMAAPAPPGASGAWSDGAPAMASMGPSYNPQTPVTGGTAIGAALNGANGAPAYPGGGAAPAPAQTYDPGSSVPAYNPNPGATPPAYGPNPSATPPAYGPNSSVTAPSYDPSAAATASVNPNAAPPIAPSPYDPQQGAPLPNTAPAVPGAALASVDPQAAATAPVPSPNYAGSMPEALRTPAAPPTGVNTDVAGAFAAVLENARHELDTGHLVEAHRQLSVWYDDPRLSAAESEQLNTLLDQVAGTVIYSTQSLLEPPHEVQAGETLEAIGKLYAVPWQLLAKINGIEDPQAIRPGERLKVVRGPFNAIVSIDKHVLTLMLNGLYAGRFGIGIGRDHPLTEGQFSVTDKVTNPTYRGVDRAMDADDPNNPLGERWISLDDKMGIHGSTGPSVVGRNDLPGCINLGARDVEDVYDILSVTSKVIVRR